MNKFGLNDKEEVLDLIRVAMTKGDYQGIKVDPYSGKKAYEIIYTQSRGKLLVIISAEEDSLGSIQSAYPKG